jgi:hypothetical protein
MRSNFRIVSLKDKSLLVAFFSLNILEDLLVYLQLNNIECRPQCE